MAGWTTPRTFVAGEVETAAIFNAHLRDNLNAINGYKEKTADQSVTSSTALVNDTHMAYAIPAVGTYVIKVNLFGVSAANAAGHFKGGFSFPSGTLHLQGWGPHNSIPSGTAIQTEWITALSATSGVTTIGYGLTTSVLGLYYRARFAATATGTLQFMWAQSVSSASASTLKAGSHMLVRQVA